MSNKTLRERIGAELGIQKAALNRLIARSPYTYKTYVIPKKSGGRRVIAQPARETKYIQNWLICNVLDALPLHKSATAYAKGSSIKKNAKEHRSSSYIVKLDFKDFFTSIKGDHIKSHLMRHLGGALTEQDIDDIIRICCIRHKNGSPLCLSIGAPSSPLISNSIMYEFDTLVSQWCLEGKINYTRYADDLTFSTSEDGISSLIEKEVRDTARKLEYPAIRFNTKKTTHLSKRHQRRITGIVINNEGRLSLGRDRKRMISSLVHKYKIGILTGDQIFQLQGLLGFAKDVEPLFLARLRGKYGAETISTILRIRKIKEQT